MLSQNEEIGRQFEHDDYEALNTLGYGEYITYTNPTWSRVLWKRERGKGADKEIKIGKYTFSIEEKFCTRKYWYRKKWFYRTVLPRFKDFKFDPFHRRIVLTNRAENFSSVSDLLKEHCIRVMNFNMLVSFLNQFTLLNNSITNNDNKQQLRVTYMCTKGAFRDSKLTEFEGSSSVLTNHEFLGEFG